MCLPAIGLESLEPNVEALLMEVYQRRDGFFGTGASPGGRAIYIRMAIQLGLAERDGYFASGQPRFRVTACGRRAGEYLAELEAQPLNRALLRDLYASGQCPLEAPPADPHYYEHWNEKRCSRCGRRRLG